MDLFMKRAVALALYNANQGGQPSGAVLVKENQIVPEVVNELHTTYVVSAHTDSIAIRTLQEKLQVSELSGYTMYASGEPCAMCLTAMYFAGIEKVFYCQSLEDAVAVGLDKSAFIYNEIKRNREDRTIKLTQMKLVEGQEDPMQNWKQKE